jgi:hypothetical protein
LLFARVEDKGNEKDAEKAVLGSTALLGSDIAFENKAGADVNQPVLHAILLGRGE